MSKGDNPAIDDLEENSTVQTGERHNTPFSDIAKAIETILSDEHADQKTNISQENKVGLIQLDTIQAHMMKSFSGYKFPSLDALKISMQEHSLSIDGYRSEQIVEIFKSIQPNIISGDVSTSSRLLGHNR
jgi:hypothetical protein